MEVTLRRRLLQNPSYYDLEATEPEAVSAFLSDMVESTLATLQVRHPPATLTGLLNEAGLQGCLVPLRDCCASKSSATVLPEVSNGSLLVLQPSKLVHGFPWSPRRVFWSGAPLATR